MRITYVINMQSKINNRFVVVDQFAFKVCFGIVEMGCVLNHVYAYIYRHND